MYKYESNGTLIESMTKMLKTFVTNNIHAIFVFDGKPSEDKHHLIKQRRQIKDDARKKYTDLYVAADNTEDDDVRAKLISEAQKMKKQCVYITHEKTATVKNLITSYDMTIIEADGEADGICSSMVTNGEAWACLSDDTDLFIHGCPRVLRNFNLRDGTCVLYCTRKILKLLNMTHAEFKQLCVLAGTDYNLEQKNSKQNNVNFLINLFMMYKIQQSRMRVNNCFYEWVVKENPEISIPPPSVFYKVVDMF